MGAGDGVVDGEHRSVEHQAQALGFVIEFVADDGHAEADGFVGGWPADSGDFGMGCVDTELVGPSCMRQEFDAGHGLACKDFTSEYAVVRDRWLALVVIDEHQWADIHVFAHGAVDGALVGIEVAGEEGEVAFVCSPVFELDGKVSVGFFAQCEDHDAAGGEVEAMAGHWTCGIGKHGLDA